METRMGRRLFNCIQGVSATQKQENAPMIVGASAGFAGCVAQTAKLEPQPQLLVALGLLKTNPRPISSSLKSTVTPDR
jgi:hypothetical protein